MCVERDAPAIADGCGWDIKLRTVWGSRATVTARGLMFFDPPDFSPLVQVETPRSAEIMLAI